MTRRILNFLTPGGDGGGSTSPADAAVCFTTLVMELKKPAPLDCRRSGAGEAKGDLAGDLAGAGASTWAGAAVAGAAVAGAGAAAAGAVGGGGAGGSGRWRSVM